MRETRPDVRQYSANSVVHRAAGWTSQGRGSEAAVTENGDLDDDPYLKRGVSPEATRDTRPQRPSASISLVCQLLTGTDAVFCLPR